MVELLKRQQTLWQILQGISVQRAMLRLSRQDDCLWVCDLPRRLMPNARMTAEMHLREAGFLVFFDSATGLWQIDLPLDDSLFTTQSIQPCPFPQKDSLHPVYALYRLLTSHPSPVEQQPAELLRGLLKCTAFPPDEIKPRITQLTGQCAALLNRKQLLPAAACYALNQYICQEDSK